MGSTGLIRVKISLTGLPEGGNDEILYSLNNTSATGNSNTTSLTTAKGTAISVVIPSSGKFLTVLPASTNTQPVSLTGSTSEVGVSLSPRGASVVSVQGGSTIYLYSSPSAVTARTVVW